MATRGLLRSASLLLVPTGGAALACGCIAFVHDDASSLRVSADGGADGGHGGGDGDGDGGASATSDGPASYPDASLTCLPVFMTGTLDSCVPCLAARCVSEIDACCSDTTCRSARQFKSGAPLFKAVDECETTNCSDVCMGVECHSSTGICSCVAASPLPKDEACSVTTVPGSICCASFDWPHDGSCECSERAECPSGLKLISHCNP